MKEQFAWLLDRLAPLRAMAGKRLSEMPGLGKAWAVIQAFSRSVDDGRFLRWVVAVSLYGLAAMAAFGALGWWMMAWEGFGRCASFPAHLMFVVFQLAWPLCMFPAFRHYLGKVRRLPGAPESDITLLPALLRLFRWGSEAVFLFAVLVAPLLFVVALVAPSALVAAWGTSGYGSSGYADCVGQALSMAVGVPVMGLISLIVTRVLVELSSVFLSMLATLEGIAREVSRRSN